MRINLYLLSFYLVLITGAFNSVLRYYLVDSPFFFLAYLSQIAMTLVVFRSFYFFLQQNKTKTFTLVLIFGLLLSVVVGTIYTHVFSQVLMGAYILIPLVYGYLIFPYLYQLSAYNHFYYLLLLTCILGVFFNIFYTLPWEGFSYIINGKEFQGNRFWTSLGARRLSGFGRSSFETAGYILFLAIVFVQKKFKVRVIWLLVGISIYYTTTKGLLLAYLLISLSILFWRFIPDILKRLLLVLIIVVNVLLPVFSWVISIEDTTNNKFLRSFEMRLESTWPEAYTLITESGNFITGRGIGGIGVPQNIFEPDKAHPGDNLFVYLLAIFGIGAFILYLILIQGILTKKRTKSKLDKFFYIISIYVFVYGITTNIIELPIMSICLGSVFRYWITNKTYEIE